MLCKKNIGKESNIHTVESRRKELQFKDSISYISWHCLEHYFFSHKKLIFKNQKIL